MGDRSADVDCELAGPAVDAAAHLFAHVAIAADAPALARASGSFDPAYVAWARSALPAGAIEPVALDAPLLAGLLSSVSDPSPVQWLLVLHDHPDQLRRAARGPLDALEAGDVASEAARVALVAAPALGASIEIARCAIALASRAYAEAWAEIVEPLLAPIRAAVGRDLAVAARQVPALRAHPVRLSHPLGSRGRAFPHQLLVGAPVGFAEVAPEAVAARVVHELAARVAGEVVDRSGPISDPTRRWAVTEHLALEGAARALAGSAMGRAHAAFVAHLDRSELDRGGEPLVEEVVDALRACGQA